jgi:nitrate/TMAO reductase-like tetraheme cytochrome c subunit
MTNNSDGVELQSNTKKETEKGIKRQPNWFKISLIANIVVVVVAVLGAGGAAVIHQSDTNPNFCGLCHIMQPKVTSYLSSNHMDNIHKKAGVQCKTCHDYPVSAEMVSGVKFLLGSYEVTSKGELVQRKFADSMCLKCHVSYDHLAVKTASLARNPHDSHNGQLPCSDCHISHGAQFDYCSQCHENGGQKMIEQQPAKRTSTSK